MKNQHGFINGALIIGIALIALIAGAVALAVKSDGRGLDPEKKRAAATVIIKRVSDLVEDHRIKVAEGDIKLGQGFSAAVANDVNYWPIEAFTGSSRGEAVAEGSVTYITDISEDFCNSINEVLQVSGIPTTENAPTDRVACVLAPETTE